jgi:L-threonylcarbamoyladenylate synthase
MLLTLDQIALAAEILKRGELVAFPTETVYGLGAPISDPEAIRKIYLVKGRPSDNPLIAHISSLDQIHQIAREIPPEFDLLAKAFFPGPLTVVLKKHPSVPSVVSGGLDTIAVRMPSHPVARELIKAVGEPIVAPSANISGRPSSTTAQHVVDDFEGKIGAVLDGGPTEYGVESTVVSLIEQPCLLRLGAVPKEGIERILNEPLGEATDQSKRSSPGTRYRHYAPKASIRLFESEQEMEMYLKAHHLHRWINPDLTVANLYAKLRQADDEGVEEIVIYCSPEMRQNRVLMDRLFKASLFKASLTH